MIGFRGMKGQKPLKQPEKINLSLTMSKIFGEHCDRDIGFTVRCGGRGSGISDRRNWDAYRVDGKVKRLNKEHAKKMMGFPDDFEFPVSDVQAMKQLGNAVAVPAIRAYAKEIIKVLNENYG